MKKFHATILVAEDNEDDQFLLKRAFQKIGVTSPLHFVSSGNEAISYMMGEGKYSDRQQFEYPTFIMTDLKMPNGNGFDVLYHLKSNPNWAVIPTVVLSSSRDLDDIKMAYALGASSFHVKPHDTTKLQELMGVLQAYWLTCEVPEVDSSGKQLETRGYGKLGERFRHLNPATDVNQTPDSTTQHRTGS